MQDITFFFLPNRLGLEIIITKDKYEYTLGLAPRIWNLSGEGK